MNDIHIEIQKGRHVIIHFEGHEGEIEINYPADNFPIATMESGLHSVMFPNEKPPEQEGE